MSESCRCHSTFWLQSAVGLKLYVPLSISGSYQNRKSIDDTAEYFADKSHPRCTSLLPPGPPPSRILRLRKTTSSSSSHHLPYSTISRCINATHPFTTPFHTFLAGLPLSKRGCLAHSEDSKPSQGDHRSVFVVGVKRHTGHRS